MAGKSAAERAAGLGLDSVRAITNPLTGGVEISAGGEPLELGSGVSYGTAAPNDADGKPDGAIYVRYAE